MFQQLKLESIKLNGDIIWLPFVFYFKDIVTESNKFDLVAFVPLLRERIYSNNQYARQFIISWVSWAPNFHQSFNVSYFELAFIFI